LGGGSNLLVSDKGFKGVVIKVQITNYKFQTNSKSQITNISAGAGLPLNKLVQLAAERGLTGLEWAAGIPGTVGGAVFGNAGWPSNKKNISSVIKWVEVLETKPKSKSRIKNYGLKDCKFVYRDSVFKHKPGLVILSVCLKLREGNIKKIKKEISEILEKRKGRTPVGFSAGSIFKNPPGKRAGELIEKCGLKGKKIGGAEISKIHANFIVNLDGATAEDVKKLINLIKKEVRKKFKIILEEEIQKIY